MSLTSRSFNLHNIAFKDDYLSALPPSTTTAAQTDLPQTTRTYFADLNRTTHTDTGTSKNSHCDVTKGRFTCLFIK